MTQNDPWAAASSNGNTQTAPQGGESSAAGQLGGGALFGGGGGESIPRLFNKIHPAGTVRGGVIVDIKDVHSTFHFNDGGGRKYWQEGQQKPVKDAVNPQTQQPNRPVIEVHLILQTDYRLTPEECQATERDLADIEKDDGRRSLPIRDMKQFGEAMAAFNAENPDAQIPMDPKAGPASMLNRVRADAKRMTASGVKGQAFPVKLSLA